MTEEKAPLPSQEQGKQNTINNEILLINDKVNVILTAAKKYIARAG